MINVHQLVQVINNDFLNDDYDFFIVISGSTGKGKSALANHILMEGNKEKYDIYKDNLYTRKEVFNYLSLKEPFKYVNVDEAINILYYKTHYEKPQIKIMQKLDEVRYLKNVIIFTAPRFWHLDSKLVNSDRVKIWIHVHQRGLGFIFKPDTNPFVHDVWHRRLNEKILEKWSSGIHPSISPNYSDSIRFEDFPPDIREKYIKMQNERKLLLDKKHDIQSYEEKLEKIKYAKKKILLTLLLLKHERLLKKGYIHGMAKLWNMSPKDFKNKIVYFRKRLMPKYINPDGSTRIVFKH